MKQPSPDDLRPFLDVDKAEVVDARATHGEVILIPLLVGGMPIHALSALADNLAWYMEKVTGRGYMKAEEVYDVGFTVREPGHQAYGLKIIADGPNAVVSRVSILEDETVFRRYVKYLHTGVYV